MSKAPKALPALHLSSGWPCVWGVGDEQGHESVCYCHGFMTAEFTIAMT